jgi:small subunit ribosomal protein S6e
MPFKIVISEPKTKKAYQIEKDVPSLIGLKIKDKFDGSMIGLSGFTLEVTGGSDKEGFPMRPDLDGISRRKVLLTKSVGFRGGKTKKVKGKNVYEKVDGMRKRKYVRGNTVSDSIMQVNCKIVEGEGDITTILGIQPKPKEEKK